MSPKTHFVPHDCPTIALRSHRRAIVAPAGRKTFASPKAYGPGSRCAFPDPAPPTTVGRGQETEPKVHLATGGRINPAGATLAKTIGR